MAKLPKPLRDLLKLDPKLKGSYETLLAEVQQAASILKTGALKAAYTELIDNWIADKGKQSLERKLDVAFKEKTRFHANRIAQTELARAHQDKVGTEFMLDDTISVVQVVMAPKHPLTDICDYHAKANLFNLGPGCYPKAKAPKPVFHPFCRCVVRSRPDLSAVKASEVPGGEAAHLRTLPIGDAARMVGSRAKLQRVLNGTSLDDVLNTGKDQAYHLKRLGDNGPMIKMMTGLIQSAKLAPGPIADRLQSLWVNPGKFAKHVAKRIQEGSISDASDYARKTFDVLANASSITIVSPLDAKMLQTGKIQVQFNEWIVLISERGSIVTSYPFVKEKITFEQRHFDAGDKLNEYSIPHNYRTALKELFGAG